MTEEYYFRSQEPLSGAPSLLWEDFKRPRLRRFPEPVDNLKLGRYLGGGVDGLVFKARVRGRTEPLAVKIVRRYLPTFAHFSGLFLHRWTRLDLTCISFSSIPAVSPLLCTAPRGTGLLRESASTVRSWR